MVVTSPAGDLSPDTPIRPPGHPEHLPWPPKWREYPEGHPGRSDEESKAPFNQDWAREDFGDTYVDELIETQRYESVIQFRGDWWQLALLLRQSESDQEAIRFGHAPQRRFQAWKDWVVVARQFHIPLHLEGARIIDKSLQSADLRGVNLTCLKTMYQPLRESVG
jgi:hypothetical protein